MKKTILAFGAVTSFVCAILSISTIGCGGSTETDDTTKVTDSGGITSAYSVLPVDITVMNQAAADTFSWLTFIAMNWPANPGTCSADTTNGRSILSGGGPVVWETYLSSDQIFVEPGSQPASWCANANPVTAMAHLPEKVKELARATGINRFIHMNAKSPHDLDEASGGPLVDQNGRFARYEIRVNEDEYNYINQNSLWSKQGQKDYIAAGDTFYFPGGESNYGSAGAMEFKAAWKVMGAGDDTTKFYCIRAIVYNDESGDPSPGPNPVTLGLVGLHIAHKTKTQFMWVWSTFEHVDNLTQSFYNPNCPECPVNQPTPDTASQNELDPNGNPLHPPTQVTRVNDVGLPDVDGINNYYQGLLQGSVWANYQLIGTQWLFFENMVPNFLANTVQETYLQGPNPPSWGNFTVHGTDVYYFKDPRYHPFNDSTSSSCSGCHYTAKSQGIHSDFSFLLGDAK